ncbi:MAG: hypothetical protein ACR2P0_00340 [Acidimicrobiales bacterium]
MTAPRRTALGIFALAMSSSALVAHAVGLGGMSPGTFGSGGASVVVCDADGLTVSHVDSASRVTDVVISAIDLACEGGDLSLTVTDTGTAVATGGPVTIGPSTTSITLAITPSADATATLDHHITIVGP